MKFFRLETKSWFLGRLWSQGATTSIKAREEEEAIREAGLTGMTGGSSPSSLGSWNPHFDDTPPPEHVSKPMHWTWAYLDHGGGSKPVVLNLWVTTPVGDSNDPFTRVTHQISCVSDIYLTIHNSSKN